METMEQKSETDKKYAQLKLKQKEKIAEWMFQATRDYYTKNYTFPNDRQIEKVVDTVYEKIEEAEIWVPYGEVLRHYKSKRAAINGRVRKALNEKEENRSEKVCFMNMCMVQDDKGNVLALDKVNDSYTGTTFPGGHVEQNEIFQKSIIREVWEETGLTIESPKLCGLYHWHEDGVHSVIMLYKAEKFTGELKSSEEGQVYWIPLEELKTRELATGMKYVLQILGSDQNANRIQIVKAGNIENALTLFHAPEDAERRKKIQNRKLLLDLSAESARIEESNRIKKELKNILTGTEYECKSVEIIDFVSAKRHQGKKALYTGALHQFGRKDGRKIYQLLKRKMSE